MDDLRERVDAVERALTDGDGDLSALADGAASAERVAEFEETLADLREDVTELEAATQALRGYVGSVRSVNEDVEQRADAAVAAVDSVEGTVASVAETVESVEADFGSVTGRLESIDERVAALEARDNRGTAEGRDQPTTTDPGRRPEESGSTIEIPTPGSTDVNESPVDDHDHTREPRRSNSTADAHRSSCPACGRGRTDAAADGGTEPGRSARRTSVREDLDGFDPAGAPERVDVREQSRQSSAGEREDSLSTGRGTPDASEPDPGFLARARELL